MQKTILIVEDEKSLREAIVDVLKRNNFLTLEAINGKEGMELALSKHPDLILLDLLMPVMDGMTALSRIRADAWGATVPVVILTNLTATDQELINDVATHKPIHYLIKSNWKLREVVAKVKDVLEMKDSE